MKEKKKKEEEEKEKEKKKKKENDELYRLHYLFVHMLYYNNKH